MPVPKPAATDLPRFATAGGAVVTSPSEGEKDVGWIAGDPAPAAKFNWLHVKTYKWLEWLNDLTNQALTWAGLQTFTLQPVFSAGLGYTRGGDSTPETEATGLAPVNRKFVRRRTLAGGVTSNEYVGPAGQIEQAVNCYWDFGTNQWKKASAAHASLTIISKDSVLIEQDKTLSVTGTVCDFTYNGTYLGDGFELNGAGGRQVSMFVPSTADQQGALLGFIDADFATLSFRVREELQAAAMQVNFATSVGEPLSFWRTGTGMAGIIGEVIGAAAGATALIFTLPANYRPPKRIELFVYDTAGAGVIRSIEINTDGTVKTVGFTSSVASDFRINAFYPVA